MPSVQKGVLMATTPKLAGNEAETRAAGEEGIGGSQAESWFRYLYFLRFSLLLWAFPGVLALLNWKMKSLASGLMVPEFPQGYLCVGFFIASTGCAALASARVTAINGPRRFGEATPEKLESLLAEHKTSREWWALALSQFWSIFFLVFLLFLCPDNKGQSPGMIFGGYSFGAVLGLFFWFVLNAWYYLKYVPVKTADVEETERGAKPKEQKTKSMCAEPRHPGRASTMIFPRACFFRTGENIENLETCTVNRPAMERMLAWLARSLVDVPGYAYKLTGDGGARLYEGQVFLLLCAAGFLGLYLTIWPITAPVPVLWLSLIMLAIALLVVAISIREFWSAGLGTKDAKSEKNTTREFDLIIWKVALTPERVLFFWKIVLTFGVTATWVVLAYLYLCTSAERFPILGSVVILTIALLWMMSGLGFFLDRYRIPVLTVLVAVMLLFHLLLPWGNDEHYFSTVPLDNAVAVGSLPTPAAVLADRLDRLGQDKPFIVVTATGGGLHASAWTAAILRRLEEIFPQIPGDAFHDRLLLLSTVSGGSVGLDAYLHALREGRLGDASGRDHFQGVAQCPELEAVGWGLIYFDLPKALLPFGPQIFWASSGDGDLGRGPLWRDRTWSLRKGISRNQRNAYCDEIWANDMEADRIANQRGDQGNPGAAPMPAAATGGLFQPRLVQNISDERNNDEAEKAYTLLRMLPDAAIPAFTMNTTSVEEGARFLLSNYVVPHYVLNERNGDAIYPAQSFLDTFRQVTNPGDPSGQQDLARLDLPLATAAQLSATFPFVSSTARAPGAYDTGEHPYSVHFGDGGYYDNDGTASALEFLRYALADPEGGATGNDRTALKRVRSRLNNPATPLRVLWIEIRNSGDYDGGKQNQAGGDGAQAGKWTLLGQAGAPLDAFWNAGHESVTGRNRNALDLLQQAYGCRLSIYRMVFADTHAKQITDTDPLNWSLTPGQRQEVRMSAQGTDLLANYQAAVNAMTNWQGTHPCEMTNTAATAAKRITKR